MGPPLFSSWRAWLSLRIMALSEGGRGVEKMRAVYVALCVVIASGFLNAMTSDKAHAVCRTMEASHNGTDMFHETGAVGAALNKLLAKVEQLRIEKAPKKVRMGQVRTKCGPWFEKYLLMHRNCIARARVCS